MRCARFPFVAVLALGSLACGANEPPGATGPAIASSESSGASESDGTSSTTAVADGSADGSSESSGPLPGTSSSGTTDDGPTSTTDGGCPPGSEGCPCDAGRCERDLMCLGDVCQSSQCDGDVFELNDAEDQAMDLGEINDDNDNGGVVSASLHHAGDVDWYRYLGQDDFPSNVDPARELVASGGLRLCKFLECDNGLAETEFECPVGTQYALSTMARPGCCSSDGFALADLNCTGVTEDNATVYIRVDQPDAACVTYAVSYHY
jgi:hypothetical protein